MPAPQPSAPTSLEPIAEDQVRDLLVAQVSGLQSSADIVTASGYRESTGERPAITVRVTREEEEPPDSGWWLCEIRASLDPSGMDADWTDARMLEIETALGDGDGLLAGELTSGRLVCMTGSIQHDREVGLEDEDGRRVFAVTANLGLLAP